MGGLEMQCTEDNRKLYVTQVHTNGLAHIHNLEQKPEFRIREGDFILSIAGVQRDAPTMLEKIDEFEGNPSVTVLAMRLERPYAVVVLSKNHNPTLGVELAPVSGNRALQVTNVLEGGLVADYNNHYPENALDPGDVIVSINDVAGDTDRMEDQLRNYVDLKLMVEKFDIRGQNMSHNSNRLSGHHQEQHPGQHLNSSQQQGRKSGSVASSTGLTWPSHGPKSGGGSLVGALFPTADAEKNTEPRRSHPPYAEWDVPPPFFEPPQDHGYTLRNNGRMWRADDRQQQNVPAHWRRDWASDAFYRWRSDPDNTFTSNDPFADWRPKPQRRRIEQPLQNGRGSGSGGWFAAAAQHREEYQAVDVQEKLLPGPPLRGGGDESRMVTPANPVPQISVSPVAEDSLSYIAPDIALNFTNDPENYANYSGSPSRLQGHYELDRLPPSTTTMTAPGRRPLTTVLPSGPDVTRGWEYGLSPTASTIDLPMGVGSPRRLPLSDTLNKSYALDLGYPGSSGVQTQGHAMSELMRPRVVPTPHSQALRSGHSFPFSESRHVPSSSRVLPAIRANR